VTEKKASPGVVQDASKANALKGWLSCDYVGSDVIAGTKRAHHHGIRSELRSCLGGYARSLAC
jgi:hypothetical protein